MRRPAAEVTDADLHALAADLRIVLVGMRKRLRQEATLGDFSFNQLQVVLRLERLRTTTGAALSSGPPTCTASAASWLARRDPFLTTATLAACSVSRK